MPWTEKELERLEAMLVQAYKWAWGLPWTTASDVFTLPSVVAGNRHHGAGIMPPPSTVPQDEEDPVTDGSAGRRVHPQSRGLLSRGIEGIGERTRGLAQRLFDMVDWRSANVDIAQLGVSRGIEGHTKKLEGEVNRQHPARVWVERQERESAAKKPDRTPTTH